MKNENNRLLVIGGSDAGIMASLNAKGIKPHLQVTVLLADEYPNLSICGLPYAISKDVKEWQSLAHRTIQGLTATGVEFEMNTIAESIDPDKHQVSARTTDGQLRVYDYDFLVVATGAKAKFFNIKGINLKNSHLKNQKVHVLHTMADYFAIEDSLSISAIKNAAIVGAGYIGLEMAEALRKRNMNVTIFQRSSEILSTVDTDIGTLVHQKLIDNNVNIVTEILVSEIREAADKVSVIGTNFQQDEAIYDFDFVLVGVGVTPNADLLVQAGAETGVAGSIKVNDYMQTSLPDIWAAGDLIETKHRLLGPTYLPLGTTAHKQGRIAGFNIAGKKLAFKGVVGTQVLTVFDLVIARTGILEREANKAGFSPFTTMVEVDDHKGYYPGSQKMKIRITGDRVTGKLLGAQLIGTYGSELAKRSDIFATAIYNSMTVAEISNLDLSYSPPVGAPWDAIQIATQEWERQVHKQ